MKLLVATQFVMAAMSVVLALVFPALWPLYAHAVLFFVCGLAGLVLLYE